MTSERDGVSEACGDERALELIAYLSGDMGSEEASRLEDHLARCGACAAAETDMRRSWQFLSVWSEPEPPPDLVPKLALALQEEAREPSGIARALSGGLLQGIGAVGLATLLVSVCPVAGVCMMFDPLFASLRDLASGFAQHVVVALIMGLPPFVAAELLLNRLDRKRTDARTLVAGLFFLIPSLLGTPGLVDPHVSMAVAGAGAGWMTGMVLVGLLVTLAGHRLTGVPIPGPRTSSP